MADASRTPVFSVPQKRTGAKNPGGQSGDRPFK
jgi:hypothetical protein